MSPDTSGTWLFAAAKHLSRVDSAAKQTTLPYSRHTTLGDNSSLYIDHSHGLPPGHRYTFSVILYSVRLAYMQNTCLSPENEMK